MFGNFISIEKFISDTLYNNCCEIYFSYCVITLSMVVSIGRCDVNGRKI